MALPARISSTTISKYLNGAWENYVENKFVFKMMKQRSKFTYNNSGTSQTWDARVGKYQGAAYEAGTARTFTSKNHYVQATLPWTEIDLTEEITQLEMKQNRGREALVKLNKRILRDMSEDMQEQLGGFILSGDGTLSPAEPSGIESFLSDDGTNPAGTGTKELNPDSTYAGLSCALGGVAALANVTTADALNDAWSPVIVNGLSTDFNGGSTWAVNALDAMRYARVRLTKSQNRKCRPDCFLLNQTDYIAVLALLDAKQTIFVRSRPDPIQGVGFDMVQFDGMTVVWDEDVPAGVGYVWNFDWSCYDFLDDKPVTVEQDDWIGAKGRLYAAQSSGQTKFNPRYFGKIITA